MLLGWIGLVLVAAALEALDERLSGVGWRNDVIDKAQFGCAVGVVELGLILLDPLSLLLGRLLAIKD